jgi:FkbM family methyltransferase
MQSTETASPPSAAGAAATPLDPMQRDLVRKAELEAALLAAPADAAVRQAYFDHLLQFAATRAGLSHALLPELGHPLYFRGATPDMPALVQTFRDGAYGFAMRATPQRILVLGAHVGYGAVALARRFPRAQVLCVEPATDNFRLLSLNTTPYRRIRIMQVAAWHSAARLAVTTRIFGDWGNHYGDDAPDAERVVPALPVGDVLAAAGWPQVDFIASDIVGAEREVFANPLSPWLRALDGALVQVHDPIAPGSDATVTACFDPTLFERQQQGERLLFLRKEPLRAMPPAPPEIALLSSEPGLQPLGLQDVASTSWGFFVYDGNACQLHPNPPGKPPARIIFPCRLAGHTQFSATMQHAGVAGRTAPVIFSLAIEGEGEGGRAPVRHTQTLKAQESVRVTVPLTGLDGYVRVILQTEMAPGAPNNYNAWARWIAPRLI